MQLERDFGLIREPGTVSVLSRPSSCFKGKWWHFNNLLLNAAKFLFPLETLPRRGNLLSCSKSAPLRLIPSAGNSAVLVQHPGCWSNCTVPVPSLPCSPLLRCSPGSPCVFCSLCVIKLHGSAKLMSGVSMASLLAWFSAARDVAVRQASCQSRWVPKK